MKKSISMVNNELELKIFDLLLNIKMPDERIKNLTDTSSHKISEYYDDILSSKAESSINSKLLLIEKARKLKEGILHLAQDSYIDFTRENELLDYYISKLTSGLTQEIEFLSIEEKKTLLITIGAAALFLPLAPVYLEINRNNRNRNEEAKRSIEKMLDTLEKMKVNFDNSKKEFLEFMYNLRTDYYETVKRMKDL